MNAREQFEMAYGLVREMADDILIGDEQAQLYEEFWLAHPEISPSVKERAYKCWNNRAMAFTGWTNRVYHLRWQFRRAGRSNRLLKRRGED